MLPTAENLLCRIAEVIAEQLLAFLISNCRVYGILDTSSLGERAIAPHHSSEYVLEPVEFEGSITCCQEASHVEIAM